MERRNFLRQALITVAGSAMLPGAVKGMSFYEEQPPFIIDAKNPGKFFDAHWNKGVGAGRANDGLKPIWQEQLQVSAQQCGFKYARYYGIFHDDMGVYNNGDYNWKQVDDLLDATIRSGLKPFVVLSFFPKDIAGSDAAQFTWNARIAPPEDLTKWTDMVTAFTKHIIAKYGEDEVGKWYFEAWNEPDQSSYWAGTKSQYFSLYKATAKAMKAVSPKVKVGGPATSGLSGSTTGAWMEEFLGYCKQEQVPVDFVTAHPFPADASGKAREVGATVKDLQGLKAIVSSRFPQAEIFVSRWSSSPVIKDAVRDDLPAAAFILRQNLETIGLVNGMFYTSFIDGPEEEKGTFHGGQGLLNSSGIAKPAFHAYRLLNMLGEELLYNKDGIVVTRHKDSKKITALMYNYPVSLPTGLPAGDEGVVSKLMTQGEAKLYSFKVQNMHPDARFNVDILSEEYGNAIHAYKEAGSPPLTNKDMIDAMKRVGMALNEEQVLSSATGVLYIEKTLKPWEVVLVDELS
jgi:xylan 1,4-beta-xylosidase